MIVCVRQLNVMNRLRFNNSPDSFSQKIKCYMTFKTYNLWCFCIYFKYWNLMKLWSFGTIIWVNDEKLFLELALLFLFRKFPTSLIRIRVVSWISGVDPCWAFHSCIYLSKTICVYSFFDPVRETRLRGPDGKDGSTACLSSLKESESVWTRPFHLLAVVFLAPYACLTFAAP